MRLPIYALVSAIILSSYAHAAETLRSFELAGNRSTIGDWTVIDQGDQTVVAIASGETTSKRQGDALAIKAPNSSFQLTCVRGRIAQYMIIPSTNVLDFRTLVDKNILLFLYVDDNKPKQGGKSLSKDDFSTTGDLTIPVSQAALGSEDVKYLSMTKKVSIKVSDESMNSTIATFKIDQIGYVLKSFEDKCGAVDDPVE